MNILPGTLGSLKSTGDSGSYWIPSMVNFPWVDSILGDSRGNMFTFQATIAEDPLSPEVGLKKVWAKLPLAVQTTVDVLGTTSLSQRQKQKQCTGQDSQLC